MSSQLPIWPDYKPKLIRRDRKGHHIHYIFIKEKKCFLRDYFIYFVFYLVFIH